MITKTIVATIIPINIMSKIAPILTIFYLHDSPAFALFYLLLTILIVAFGF
jgi:hypothetical protein